MKRWHEDYFHTYREWKKDSFHENRAKGFYRKRKAFDCGNSQCRICHSDKFPVRELTKQEMKAKLKFKEQCAELNDHGI